MLEFGRSLQFPVETAIKTGTSRTIATLGRSPSITNTPLPSGWAISMDP